MAEREFITVEKFVERHKNISRKMVYDMVRRGKIIPLPIGKRNYLIPSDALDTIYQEQLAAHERAR